VADHPLLNECPLGSVNARVQPLIVLVPVLVMTMLLVKVEPPL
jgi:hypothetical protein